MHTFLRSVFQRLLPTSRFPLRMHANANTSLLRNASALLVAGTLLGGCASITPTSETAATTETSTRSYQQNIELGGRLSVQYQQNGNDEFLHGSFTWKQAGDRSQIALLSPLGQTIATIDIAANGATLTESGKAPRTASDVDALVAQTLGWPLPIAGLRQWLQGFAIDANNKSFVASSNSSAITTRDGWQIRYANWQQSDAGSYAKRIDLGRQTSQAGKVDIRIVIDNWQAR